MPELGPQTRLSDMSLTVVQYSLDPKIHQYLWSFALPRLSSLHACEISAKQFESLPEVFGVLVALKT